MERQGAGKAAPTRRSVDDGKVTDHHALLVTGEKPLFLSKEDNTIYQMIAGRMVEAFSENASGCDHCHGGMCRSGVYRKRQRREANRMACRLWRGKRGNYHPRLAGRRHADTESSSITEGKTKPKPLHTEATLLSAMETAGRKLRTTHCGRR